MWWFITSILLVATSFNTKEWGLLIPAAIFVVAGEINSLRRDFSECITFEYIDEDSNE